MSNSLGSQNWKEERRQGPSSWREERKAQICYRLIHSNRTEFSFVPATVESGWNPILPELLCKQQESGCVERMLAKEVQV